MESNLLQEWFVTINEMTAPCASNDRNLLTDSKPQVFNYVLGSVSVNEFASRTWDSRLQYE